MKRAVALLLVLTVLGAAGMVYAHHVVDDSAEAVEMYETVLSGDRAAAEGVEVKFPMECGMRLYWDTTLRVGAENETRTDFSYSAREDYREQVWLPNTPLSLGVSDNISGEMLPEPEHELYALLSDVASRVDAGVSGCESVRLRDYYEYMPLHVYVTRKTVVRKADTESGIDGYVQFDDVLERQIRELYAIPVPEDYYLNVYVDKNAVGDVIGWSVLPQQEEQVLQLDYATTSYETTPSEQGLWVTAHLSGGDGRFSCAGAGKLWYIPDGGAGEPVRVMELEPDEEVQIIETDALGRALVPISGDGGYYIKVVDAAGCLQTLELPELEENDAISPLSGIRTGEDFLLVKSFMGHFELFELTESGEYVQRLSGELHEATRGTSYSDRGLVAHWDGRRLVMATENFSSELPRMRLETGFTLWVFDVDGGSFCAQYESSLAMPEYPSQELRAGELEAR